METGFFLPEIFSVTAALSGQSPTHHFVNSLQSAPPTTVTIRHSGLWALEVGLASYWLCCRCKTQRGLWRLSRKKKKAKYFINNFVLITCWSDNTLDKFVLNKTLIPSVSFYIVLFYMVLGHLQNSICALHCNFYWTALVLNHSLPQQQ